MVVRWVWIRFRGQFDRASATTIRLRVNGTETAFRTGSSGTGNFGNSAMAIGARIGNLEFLNGHFYGLVVRGVLSRGEEIADIEGISRARQA